MTTTTARADGLPLVQRAELRRIVLTGESVADFIARADRALYRSKREGRDRVTLAG